MQNAKWKMRNAEFKILKSREITGENVRVPYCDATDPSKSARPRADGFVFWGNIYMIIMIGGEFNPMSFVK